MLSANRTEGEDGKMFEMQIYEVLIVPVIIGIVQLFKKAGLNPKFAGLIALVLGFVVAFTYGLTEAGWTVFQCLLIGAAWGLSASGLYSTQKNMREPAMHIGNLPDELNPEQEIILEDKSHIQSMKTFPEEDPPERR